MTMELYLHRTTGGAEYYVTNPQGSMSFPDNPPVLRTDGDELEVMSIDSIKRAGFKSVKLKMFTDNERADILNALYDKRNSYREAMGNEFAQQRMEEIEALMNKLNEII